MRELSVLTLLFTRYCSNGVRIRECCCRSSSLGDLMIPMDKVVVEEICAWNAEWLMAYAAHGLEIHCADE